MVTRIDLILIGLDFELPALNLEHIVSISRLSWFVQIGKTKGIRPECVSEFSRLGIDTHEVLGDRLSGVCE
eukprot:scaffold12921_cov103-Cylindrotheca_fusiformis.AAC.1